MASPVIVLKHCRLYSAAAQEKFIECYNEIYGNTSSSDIRKMIISYLPHCNDYRAVAKEVNELYMQHCTKMLLTGKTVIVNKQGSITCLIEALSSPAKEFLDCHVEKAENVVVELDTAVVMEYINYFLIQQETKFSKKYTMALMHPHHLQYTLTG